MSTCRVVGMGCYGKIETFNRILAKLLPQGAGLADAVLKANGGQHLPRETVSLCSGGPLSSGQPAALKPSKLNISGFKMRNDGNLTICLGQKPTAAQKIIFPGKRSGETESG